jgi:hypothetical protein
MIPHWYTDACMERAATEHERAAITGTGSLTVPACSLGGKCQATGIYAHGHSSADPVAEILAVLCEPVGLAGQDLPDYLDTPPGTCRICHRGPLYRQSGLCLYCYSLAGLSGDVTAAAKHTVSLPDAHPAWAKVTSATDPFGHQPAWSWALFLTGCLVILAVILAVHGVFR